MIVFTTIGCLSFVTILPLVWGSSSLEEQFEMNKPLRICGSRMADILEKICADYGGVAKRADMQLLQNGSPENPWGVGLSIWETSPFSGFELARMRRRDSLSETCRINPEDKLLCQCCPKYNNNQGCTIFQILSFCASKTKQPRKW
ncbi:uncharacterized protein LOC111269418 [Varroa jacobsoni]|uniref:uncharacterized protein LOC111269418 n=1 Tax=Varroa jacobsoni TaxID=62625 RepID=UPI000BF8B02B|nr:uncharacterized protein LOC111269418 [Varroa jacobsoni]